MTNSQLFKQAHAMTKQVIQSGDNYAATFGLCLKAIKAEQALQAVKNVNFAILAIIVLVISKIQKTVLSSKIGKVLFSNADELSIMLLAVAVILSPALKFLI